MLEKWLASLPAHVWLSFEYKQAKGGRSGDLGQLAWSLKLISLAYHCIPCCSTRWELNTDMAYVGTMWRRIARHVSVCAKSITYFRGKMIQNYLSGARLAKRLSAHFEVHNLSFLYVPNALLQRQMIPGSELAGLSGAWLAKRLSAHFEVHNLSPRRFVCVCFFKLEKHSIKLDVCCMSVCMYVSALRPVNQDTLHSREWLHDTSV